MLSSAARALERFISVAALASLAACGGGGGDSGTTMGEGSGTPVFTGQGPGTSVFDSSGSGGGGGQTGDGERPTADPTVQVSSAQVQGEVLSANSGAAIAGADVTFETTNLVTDSSGFYSQATYPANSRLIVHAAASSFEDMYLPLPVVSGVPAVGVFKLTPQGTSTAVPASGGSVTAADGVGRVTFPASSLESAPGVPVTGSVDVRLTTQNVGTDAYAVSGDYTSSTNEPLETFGAVVLSNSSGALVASGAAVVLRIPVSTRATTRPTSANLYRLDATTARWVQAGSASLVSATEGAYYEGTIDQFGQWMVGVPLSSPVSVNGCVEDDSGAPVADARIVAEGISYSGLSFVSTDAAGRFSVPVKAGSSLLVTGRRGAILTDAVPVTSTTTDTTLTSCLTLPSTNAATVRLTWGASPRDIDSHLHEPGGAHVFYGNKGSLTAEPFAKLDVDDTDGFGPEITTIRRPKVGIYRFYLLNFSQTFSPGMTGSPTRVELNYGGRTVVFTPPSSEGSALHWHLFDLEIGSNCSMTLYRYNRWRADEPANPNTGTTAQVCVP